MAKNTKKRAKIKLQELKRDLAETEFKLPTIEWFKYFSSLNQITDLNRGGTNKFKP